MSIFKELEDFGFSFNKNFGQNFITDKNLLSSITRDANLNSNDTVLEIGTGAGTLTQEIATICKKIVSYEIDNNLKEYLLNKFRDENNVEIVFADFLKLNNEIIEEKFNGENIKIIANLPYYITTPLIFKLLNSNLNISSATLMVQKEVANRIVAKPKSKDYGELSVVLQTLCDVEITRIVPSTLFTPKPKVDSAIVKLTPIDKYNILNKDFFFKTVRACFFSRRKTLVNNLSAYFNISKTICENVLNNLNLSTQIRGEEFSIQQMISLSEKLETEIKKQQK